MTIDFKTMLDLIALARALEQEVERLKDRVDELTFQLAEKMACAKTDAAKASS